jgi:hypothetical protein
MMPLDYALKAAPLADSDDVDKTLAFKNVDQHAVARLDYALGRLARSVDFDPTSRMNFTGGRLCLAKVSAHRLGQRDSFTNSTRPICADS